MLRILSVCEEVVSLGNAHIIKNKEKDLFYLVIPFGPVEVSKVGSRLLGVLTGNGRVRDKKRSSIGENTVGEFLLKLGIPKNIRGFYYLKTAVMYILNGTDLIHMSGRLYSVLAAEYNTTVSKIERSIRYAVSTAFDKGDLTLLSEVFGSSYNTETGRPANLEAVASIAEALSKISTVQ